VPEELIVKGIRAGLTKINVSTHLNAAFTVAIREYLTMNPVVVDSRKYVAAGREAVLHEAARLLAVFALTTKETG
jgi:fructose-bisphosphate aldolase class II